MSNDTILADLVAAIDGQTDEHGPIIASSRRAMLHRALTAARAALAAPAQQPTDWREAVLDALASTGGDMPVTATPAEIVRAVIDAHVQITLDPRVSDAAPAQQPEPVMTLPEHQRSAPLVIYLHDGDDGRTEPFPGGMEDGVTWSADNATGNGVAYVRADIAGITSPSVDAREAVARAICTACDEIPDHAGDCQGNDWRWQDYLGAADAAIAAATHAPAAATGKPGLQVADAMTIVIHALQDDPGYAWSWHCNVAMAAVDEGVDHATANHAAARFMRLLASVEPAHELPPKIEAPVAEHVAVVAPGELSRFAELMHGSQYLYSLPVRAVGEGVKLYPAPQENPAPQETVAWRDVVEHAATELGELDDETAQAQAAALRELLDQAPQAPQQAECPECIEQARLLGAGGEREAALTAEIEQLRRVNEQYGQRERWWNDKMVDLEHQVASHSAGIARLQQICTSIHDGLLRGDDDRELIDLAAQAWDGGQAPQQAEPDWDEIRKTAELATGLPVERHTYSLVIREVRAWLAANQAPGMGHSTGWQPIETAPRDGTEILLGRAESEDLDSPAISVPGYWQEGYEDGVDYMGCDSGFVDSHHQDFSGGRSFGPESHRYAPNQPTHWMPLPAAPVSATQVTSTGFSGGSNDQ